MPNARPFDALGRQLQDVFRVFEPDSGHWSWWDYGAVPGSGPRLAHRPRSIYVTSCWDSPAAASSTKACAATTTQRPRPCQR